MKRFFFFVFLLKFSGSISGQGINNLWLLGYDSWNPGFGGINFDFSSGNLMIDSFERKMNFSAANASICNSNGNILFYTNGLWISNSSNDTMTNGSGLNPGQVANDFVDVGHPMSQMSIILAHPTDTNLYYIFHEAMEPDQNWSALQFYYTLVDMTLDSGRGGVVYKNNVFFTDSLFGGEITATKHANGRDWWIITHRIYSDVYIEVLLTPWGLFGPYFQSIGVWRQSVAQAAFSPQGDKYARYDTFDHLELFDFDRCTGLFSNHIQININDSMIGGGVAFSPNGRFVYASSGNFVYQFDLWSPNIPSSIQTVAVWDSTYSPVFPFAAKFLFMQLAPDGKIYIVCPNGTVDMHVINYPDSLGLACDLQQHNVHLPYYNARTIPNHPNYFLGALTGSICDSLTGISESENKIPIRINPNPAQSAFYLNYEMPYGKTAIATIYNTLGDEVMRKSLYWYFGYLQIDCSGLSNGVYFIKVEGKGVSGSAKLVIAR